MTAKNEQHITWKTQKQVLHFIAIAIVCYLQKLQVEVKEKLVFLPRLKQLGGRLSSIWSDGTDHTTIQVGSKAKS